MLQSRLGPLFVVGCPRSGTTLLSQLLDESPWGSPIETHFIPKYYLRLRRLRAPVRRGRLRAEAAMIMRERPLLQFGIKADVAALEHGNYARFVDHLLMQRAIKAGKDSWGDKTPHYMLHVELLWSLFPDAKFIRIIRDGRDVAVSLLRKPWGPANYYCAAHLWAQYLSEFPVLQKLRERKSLLDVCYEDLLGSPVDTMRMIESFLGQSILGERTAAKIGDVRRDNHSKWRTAMAPADIAIFESVCSQTLQRFGYATSHGQAPIPFSVRAACTMRDRVKRLYHFVAMNTFEEIAIRFGLREPFGR